MSLTGRAINYLQRQYPNSSFLDDIILQDDGGGPYIKHWGIGTPKPTEEELDIAALSMIVRPPIPTTEEKLDMLYNDMKNGTQTFVRAVDAAKGIQA